MTKIKLGKRTIDKCDYMILATCPACNWRAEARTEGHAWYLVARHLKNYHREPAPARLAERNAQRRGYTLSRGDAS